MSNLEELEVKNVCSLSCDAPTNMCSLLGDHTCGDSSCTTSDRYVKILDFRHFESFFRFDKDGSNRRKKTLSNGVDVSVVLDVVTGNTR